MINNYLVEDFYNELEDFTSFLTLTASNIEPNFKHRPSVVAKDSALILTRLLYIESIQKKCSTKNREKWMNNHEGYIRQSYDQLTRWTGLNANSINRAIAYLTEKGIIEDKAKDTSLYVKLNLSFLQDVFYEYVLINESKRWWSNFKFINSYLTLLLTLGNDTKARHAIDMLIYFSFIEDSSSKLTLNKIRADLNETRETVLKCIELLQRKKFINDKYRVNREKVSNACSENKKFKAMIDGLYEKRQHNLDRLYNNKKRLLYPLAIEQVTQDRKSVV